MVYGTYNELVTGAYKPTNITGGPHIVVIKKTYRVARDPCKTLNSIRVLSIGVTTSKANEQCERTPVVVPLLFCVGTM